jgi:hypothetical protein
MIFAAIWPVIGKKMVAGGYQTLPIQPYISSCIHQVSNQMMDIIKD